MLIRTQFQDRCLDGFRPNTELWGFNHILLEKGRGEAERRSQKMYSAIKSILKKKFNNFAKEK